MSIQRKICYVLIFGILMFRNMPLYGYEAAGRRDPFVPLVGVAREVTGTGIDGIYTIDDVRLQGVLVGAGGRNSVIVNGEIISEGDQIARLFVESITDNIVTLKIDGERHVIQLYEEQ